MPVAAVRYASPASIPADLPRYAALSYPTGSVVPGDVKRLECGLYLPSESVPADRRRVGVVQYLPGATIPTDMRRIIPVRSGAVAYANAVLADSPSAYWRLGEASGTSAADASGNGNTGTYTGGVTLGQVPPLASEPDGTVNPAALFSKAGTGKVDVSGTGYLPLTNTSRSVELWFKPNAATGRHALFSYGNTSGNGTLFAAEVGQLADGLLIFLGNGTGDVNLGGVGTVLGAWHHLVFTYDGTSLRTYLDGTVRNTTAVSLNTATVALTIGANGIVYGDNYIDEVAVYPTALSSARVAAHYAAGTGR